MKVGDLVHMPGQTLIKGEDSGIGLVVDMSDSRTHRSWPGKGKRVGIMWVDGGGVVDFEPIEWLEVISESR